MYSEDLYDCRHDRHTSWPSSSSDESCQFTNDRTVDGGPAFSLFAQTLKEQDDLFYLTFPDARPLDYQFNVSFSPSSCISCARTSLGGFPCTSKSSRSVASVNRSNSAGLNHRDDRMSLLQPVIGAPTFSFSSLANSFNPLDVNDMSPSPASPCETPRHLERAIPPPLSSGPFASELKLLGDHASDHHHSRSLPPSTVSIASPSHTPPTTPGYKDGKDRRLALAGPYHWPARERRNPVLLSPLTTDLNSKAEAAGAYPSPADSHVDDNTSLSPKSTPVGSVVGVGKSVPPSKSTRAVKKHHVVACLFCRGRKIACASGTASDTCNQCERRSLTCEFPDSSRRGARKIVKKAKPRDADNQ